ncbi:MULTISPECIES: PilZ domain-containing protein [unclassified Nitrobacter]|nr:MULTISPECIES: PilZ domain-containing protein [unclassified Nitrobacter]MCB1393016.1 PilZ domain-containing protein [Nitrobacter sp.]MCV0385870.1 PilZ domain-containing protein [Nitrobacter sp.]
MNSPTEDRRKHPRVEIDEPAYISTGGLSMRCRLLNASPQGAALEVPNPAVVPSRFQLMTEKDRVIRPCRVIWIKQNRIGISFDSPIAEAVSGVSSRDL